MNNTAFQLVSSHHWLEKTINTFLPHPVIGANIYDPRYWARQSYQELPKTFMERVWRKLKRGLRPGINEIDPWATQKVGGRYDPINYTVLQPQSYVLVDEVAARASAKDSKILDLGCNCGRHLNALDQRGFTNLYGVDIGQEALTYMDTVFPELSNRVQLSCASFQQFLLECAPHQYEILFTFGATVELVHPSFPLVRYIARATTRYVVLAINENGQAYPRWWEYEFERAGFLLVKLLRPITSSHPISLLVFERIA